jgi:hypothetical protein
MSLVPSIVSRRVGMLISSGLVLLSACSPGPVPVSQSPRDPSSPLAPEASQVQAAEVQGHGVEAHEAHAASADGGPQGPVYVCPMHSDVTSTVPDAVCSKCNMKLVPKK